MFASGSPHLKSHLGQEGELVLLKQGLAGIQEQGVGDTLYQHRDAALSVLHPLRLLDGSVEQRVEGLGNSMQPFKGDTWCLHVQPAYFF